MWVFPLVAFPMSPFPNLNGVSGLILVPPEPGSGTSREGPTGTDVGYDTSHVRSRMPALERRRRTLVGHPPGDTLEGTSVASMWCWVSFVSAVGDKLGVEVESEKKWLIAIVVR